VQGGGGLVQHALELPRRIAQLFSIHRSMWADAGQLLFLLVDQWSIRTWSFLGNTRTRASSCCMSSSLSWGSPGRRADRRREGVEGGEGSEAAERDRSSWSNSCLFVWRFEQGQCGWSCCRIDGSTRVFH
jgi:hypothetical protein